MVAVWYRSRNGIGGLRRFTHWSKLPILASGSPHILALVVGLVCNRNILGNDGYYDASVNPIGSVKSFV